MGLFKNDQPQQQMPMQYPSQPNIQFNDDQRDDLTRFQVDLSQTKSDISHWLNGDMPKDDERGKIKWN